LSRPDPGGNSPRHCAGRIPVVGSSLGSSSSGGRAFFLLNFYDFLMQKIFTEVFI
jgi:hypothetical protein